MEREDNMTKVKVTQADRDAAAKFISRDDGDFPELYALFASHRIAALEALYAELAADPRVAFLQGDEIAAWYLASGDPA